MIDILLLAVIAIVTWSLSGEGAWGSVMIFFSVLFAGILATNFFEPLANFLEVNMFSSGEWRYRCDFMAFIFLFAGFTTLLRLGGEFMTPIFMHTDGIVHDVSRWAVGLLTGYVTAAILLFSLHMTALPREFLGFKAERKNFFNTTSPDRQWIAYMQYISEFSFSQGQNIRIFDGARYAVLPGQNDEVWSSFPMKYAERRGMIEAGINAQQNPTTEAPQFTPSAAPPASPNGEGGGPAF